MRLKISAFMLGAAMALMATAADARPVKWARAADALTLDPHGQNEGPTIAFNGQIYDPLIARDNANKLIPALATSWKLVDPTTWEFKLRQNVKFHNGDAFTADDVVFSFQRALQPTSDYKGYLANTKEIVTVDRLHGAPQDQRPEPAGAGQPHHRLHHEQEVGGGEQRHQAAGLQEQGRELRGAQRQRHRPVHARLARAGREDGGEAQRRLLGPQRGPARDHRTDADHHQAGRDPRRRAALRRSRLRAGRAGAGHRAAEGLAEPARHRRAGEPHDLPRLRRRLATSSPHPT